LWTEREQQGCCFRFFSGTRAPPTDRDERKAVPRILTYNVHRCLGIDGRLSPARIAEVIASCEPDIVALQELDVGRIRTGGIDQARAIADELRMHLLFHPAVQVVEELYGDAILTPRACKLVKAEALPTWSGRAFVEPRGALWACVNIAGAEIQVINTHLGLRGPERLRQIDMLLGHGWLGHSACRDPIIVAGDFNAIPRSRVYRRLAEHLFDAQTAVGRRRQQPTYPSRAPFLRLDHVFVSRSIEVRRAETVRTPLARIASDHLPLVVDFRVIPARERHA
jgi:endonuclease/exonuclease/phosphatase family metal-dependent hydrolase